MNPDGNITMAKCPDCGGSGDGKHRYSCERCKGGGRVRVDATPPPVGLTVAEIEAIEARAAAASAGPWATHWEGRAKGCPCGEVYGPDGDVGIHHAVTNDYFDIIPGPDEQIANSNFIAASRTDIPLLCQELRRLLEREAVLVEAIESHVNSCDGCGGRGILWGGNHRCPACAPLRRALLATNGAE